MIDTSIIIVSYNTEKLTIDCVKSVLNEGSSLKKEIIVVDNNSSDGTVSALRKLRNVKIIENKENLGFSKANNQGIKVAKGEHILLLNSDTKVKRGVVKELIDFAKKTPNVGVVGPRLLNPDGSIQASVFRFPTIFRAIKQYWFAQKGILDKYSPKEIKPCMVESLVMAAFLITPKALKKVGLLDERYFMYFEDLDYCRRVKKAGLKTYYYPNAEVIHYHGASVKKLADHDWRRLIPSSKIYHGNLKHYFINFVIWLGQKREKYVY